MNPSTREIAERIADDLFHNGAGEEADRLVLTKDNNRDGHSRQPTRDLGGWSKRAVAVRVEVILAAAIRGEEAAHG